MQTNLLHYDNPLTLHTDCQAGLVAPAFYIPQTRSDKIKQKSPMILEDDITDPLYYGDPETALEQLSDLREYIQIRGTSVAKGTIQNGIMNQKLQP